MSSRCARFGRPPRRGGYLSWLLWPSAAGSSRIPAPQARRRPPLRRLGRPSGVHPAPHLLNIRCVKTPSVSTCASRIHRVTRCGPWRRRQLRSRTIICDCKRHASSASCSRGPTLITTSEVHPCRGASVRPSPGQPGPLPVLGYVPEVSRKRLFRHHSSDKCLNFRVNDYFATTGLFLVREKACKTRSHDDHFRGVRCPACERAEGASRLEHECCESSARARRGHLDERQTARRVHRRAPARPRRA